MSHRPPKNDRERLENLLEALSEPDADDDDEIDEEIRAQLARRGLTMETWAAEIRAKAQAALDRNRRARRMRMARIAGAGALGLAAVAGVALAIWPAREPRGNAGYPILKTPPPPVPAVDAGAPSSSGTPGTGRALPRSGSGR